MKRKLFERFGVKEFWLADPLNRHVEQFVLENGQYRLAAVWHDQDVLESPTIPCLRIDLREVFPSGSLQ